MESIESIRNRDVAAFDAMVQKVREAGTDNLSFFGGGYTHEGGYSLQQNPEELAALTLLLRGTQRARDLVQGTGRVIDPLIYVEIGSASGGTCRFLHENVNQHGETFYMAWVVDNHGHHRWPEQQKNFDAMGSHFSDMAGHITVVPRVQKWIGDSHSADAAQWLLSYAEYPDVVFIDGDHTYEGVLADYQMVKRVPMRDTLIIFHDTVACEGVKTVWEEAKRECQPVAEFIGSGRQLGIGVVRVGGGS